MVGTKQVRLSGSGGQGIVLAGTILGQAAVNDGKWVAESSSYGAAARGGSCYSDVVISDQPTIFPHVIKADVLVAMSQTAYDGYLKLVNPENGTVIYDPRLVSVRASGNLKQIAVPATDLALKELGNKLVANMVMLGAVVARTGMVSANALISAIEKTVDERFKELNVRAARLGLKLAQAETKES